MIKNALNLTLPLLALVTSVTCSLPQIALADVNTVSRTKAVSALSKIVERKIGALNDSSRDVEAGGDIILICVGDVFSEWGQPVFQSIMAVPSAQDEESLNIFLNMLDRTKKNMALLTQGRKDLARTVLDVRKEFQEAGLWQALPADLNFETFLNYETPYMQALMNCQNSDFLSKVSEKLVPLQENAEINGTSVGIARTEISIPIGIIGTGMPGIVPSGAVGVQLMITDKSEIYSKTQTYSEWVRALVRVN